MKVSMTTRIILEVEHGILEIQLAPKSALKSIQIE
jgi:hypothetical protein